MIGEITSNAQFQFYDNKVPLSKDESNAVPIVLSDDKAYLSSFLTKAEKKYAISAGYFSSAVNTLILPNIDGTLKLILIKPSSKKRFSVGDRIARLPAGKYILESEMPEARAPAEVDSRAEHPRHKAPTRLLIAWRLAATAD